MPTGKRSDHQRKYISHTHACLQASSVGSNSILECKLLSKNAHRTSACSGKRATFSGVTEIMGTWEAPVREEMLKRQVFGSHACRASIPAATLVCKHCSVLSRSPCQIRKHPCLTVPEAVSFVIIPRQPTRAESVRPEVAITVPQCEAEVFIEY